MPSKVHQDDTNKHTSIRFEEEEIFTAREVAAAIDRLKPGKVAGEDEIRSEMLKALQ